MNIFCGVQATGRGHLSRYAVVREPLQAAGHTVYGFASGQELPSYAEGINRFSPGPTFNIRRTCTKTSAYADALSAETREGDDGLEARATSYIPINPPLSPSLKMPLKLRR